VALLRGHLDLRARIVPSEELPVTILLYNEQAARRFGRTKADLERAGVRLSDLDLQIASIALEYGVPLVTHNLRHFERVPGLTIEDWLE
jgi:tRNA(fMet)-specific endonuclease VapC